MDIKAVSEEGQQMQEFLEQQALDFAQKFPKESFESPKATSTLPVKKQQSLIDLLFKKKLSPSK